MMEDPLFPKFLIVGQSTTPLLTEQTREPICTNNSQLLLFMPVITGLLMSVSGSFGNKARP